MENFNGVLITFDLKIEKLKIYFDYKNPKYSYTIIRNYLTSLGFEKSNDSDYISNERNLI